MHRRDVDAVIEMLFVAQDLKNLRDQGAINHHVVLRGIGQRLEAGTVGAFEFRDHW